MDGWATELLHENFRLSLRATRLIYSGSTAFQTIRIFENPRFGRVLMLDNAIQLTEADEFIYHEMLAHVPLLAHGSARRVLLIGGGDGGLAREVLRHRTVERLAMVEIDSSVIDLAKAYLPAVSRGAFEDPRLEIVISDGADYLATATEQFDVAIVDSPDPVGPGAALFTDEFYAAVARRLDAAGILVTQNGMPFAQPDELRNTMRAFRALFTDAACYLATVPTYSGGPMVFSWGTDCAARQVPVSTLESRLAASGIVPRYYTPEVHKAAFALPAYVGAIAAGRSV
jgi:spermidine synthase